MFYPSTVFLDDLPRAHAECVAAKAAGEAVCALLNRRCATLHVLVMRLARLKTDQTASLSGAPRELRADAGSGTT